MTKVLFQTLHCMYIPIAWWNSNLVFPTSIAVLLSDGDHWRGAGVTWSMNIVMTNILCLVPNLKFFQNFFIKF